MTDDEKIDFLKKHKGKKCYMWDEVKPDKPNRYLYGIRIRYGHSFIDEKGVCWGNCEPVCGVKV